MEAATYPDPELARQLIEGSPAAFEQFVAQYYAKIFRYSYTLCGQREDAEEVAQETLMNVFEHLDQLRDPARLKPWVFQIARNSCLMKRRRSLFAPEHEVSLDELRPAGNGDGSGMTLEIADWSQLPEAAAADGELRKALARAVDRLPDLYKAVFLLREVEELSTEDCAEILGVTSDAVKTRLHRARLMLRKTLDDFVRGYQRNEGKANE